ncbi:VPS10 domain-containing protein [Capnocytophaga canis]|uniref:VPS10 domain-containing protein n=1 Tax=Capnocytophaga canis TaxID=1848903 RepID=UPI001561EACB|nr:hypothetical protein [Capnocytophaga canis]
MKRFLHAICCMILISCQNQNNDLQGIEIKERHTFSLEGKSVRAMVLLDKNIGFAGSGGVLGFINTQNLTMEKTDFLDVEYRSVAATTNDFYMLSVGSPAMLFSTQSDGFKKMYEETHEKAFYDSMLFLDNQFGIAVGDPTDDCMSVLTTHDGGKTWQKKSCDQAPKLAVGEALFAASNSNIANVENLLWVITGGSKSRIFSSEDKGVTWKSTNLPIVQGNPSQGAFSVSFYDKNNGIVMGGDYKNPTLKAKSGAITTDGGKTWQVIDETSSPGYISCVRYIPNSEGKGLVATSSSNGIWSSVDSGKTWEKISEKGYHSLLFVDENTLVASGNEEITLFKYKKY